MLRPPTPPELRRRGLRLSSRIVQNSVPFGPNVRKLVVAGPRLAPQSRKHAIFAATFSQFGRYNRQNLTKLPWSNRSKQLLYIVLARFSASAAKATDQFLVRVTLTYGRHRVSGDPSDG